MPMRRATPRACRWRAITSPVLSTISRGSSGLPVAWAGHTLVQRPHIVQASVSSSCFQVKSSTTEAPKVSSSVSMRFGIGFIAPLGRSWSLQVHVQRRREHVAQHRDRQDHEEGDERDDVGDPHRPGATSRRSVERPAVDERATAGSRRSSTSRSSGVPSTAMRNISATKPVTPMSEERAEDHRVLGLGLDADAVRAAGRSGARSPTPRRRGTRAPAASPTNA